MSLPVNDAYVTTFDYSVEFDLDAQTGTITDESTYVDTTGVSISIAITFPTSGTTTVAVVPNGSATFDLPTLNNQPAYGYYYFTGSITDPTDTYTDSQRSFNLCKPSQCEDEKSTDGNGCLNFKVTFLCSDNKVLYTDNSSYVYKETEASTVTYDVTVIDPNNIKQVDSADISTFIITPIVNGRYSFTIDNVAVYEFDNNFTVIIHYQATNEQFTAACDVNLCDVRCKMKAMYKEYKAMKGNGSEKQRILKEQLAELVLLIELVEVGIECGDDVTAEVLAIEAITGESCSCGCGNTSIHNSGGGGGCDCDIQVEANGGDVVVEQTNVGSSTIIKISDQHYEFEGESGIAVEAVEAGDTTTVTISNEILIQKTAFVTPSGNDSTGTLGDFTKPFATIKKAVQSTTSNSGHCVYVFPGSYTDTIINVGTNGVEKTGLYYYFVPGAIVTSTGANFWTSGTAGGSVVIRGGGTFISSMGVINSIVDYTFDIECLSLQTTSVGTNTCVFYSGGGTFRIKCSSMTSSASSCMDIRTTSSTGYVECDLLDNQTAAASTPCVKFNTGGTHNWTFYVKELKTMSNAASNCGGVVIINTTAKVYWKGNVYQNQVAASGFCGALSVNGGLLIYEGDVKTVSGHGLVCIAGQIVIRSSTVRAGGDWSAIATMEPAGTGLVIGTGCNFVNNSATVATISHMANAVGSVQLGGCAISNENATANTPAISLTNVSQVLRLSNCTVYIGVGTGISITASVNVNTVIVNTMSNVGVAGAGTITNLVSAISVDAQFIQTIYTP